VKRPSREPTILQIEMPRPETPPKTITAFHHYGPETTQRLLAETAELLRAVLRNIEELQRGDSEVVFHAPSDRGRKPIETNVHALLDRLKAAQAVPRRISAAELARLVLVMWPNESVKPTAKSIERHVRKWQCR